MTEHTHKQFDAEMELIRGGVLPMRGLVEKQMTRADAAPRRRLRGTPLPAAIDLLMIMTVTKVVNDLERIGDEAKKVVFKAEQAGGSGRLAPLRNYDVTRALEAVRR